MFRAGLNIYGYRSRCGIPSSWHLLDRQNVRPWWQPSAIVATLYDVRHSLAVDLKIETEIPSEVRRSIDNKSAGWDMTRMEVRPSSRNSADENCASKN